MENVIDIRTALKELGTGWQFGGSVTDGTQEAWDAVVWEDARAKPTWDALCAAHEGIALQNALAAIEAEYAPKITALQTALVAATLTDGSIMDGNIASLRTEWVALLNAKSAAMEALLI